MLLKKPNTLNYPILFWNIAKFFQIVFRYLKHLDRLFVFLNLGKFCKTGEFMKKYFPALSQISLKIIVVQAPTIPHFKGLDMRNLQYEIRVCPKQHTKVSMTLSML